MMFFKPMRTGKRADSVYAVKVGMVNFFIYRNGEDMICIDSGFKEAEIVRELNLVHIDPDSITHLFLTHSDYDHAGGVKLFTGAKIYLSADEEEMITRRKARQLGCIYNARIPGAYNLLNDGDVITAGSIKIQAIATPGHTPGSMSYLVDDRVLFTGDTLILRDSQAYIFKRYFNMDTELQKQSIRKLARLKNIRMICTAHSGHTEEFDKAMASWK